LAASQQEQTVRSAEATPPAYPTSERNRWPARLDALESATGLTLAAFMLVHTLFASSILLGPDAMGTLARAFEGYYLFGRSCSAPVVAIALAVTALFVVHAVLAVRRIPSNHRQFAAMQRARAELRHADTTLWGWQVFTGFTLMFLAGIHLFGVLAHPDRLNPADAAAHVWSGRAWLLYLLLLPAAEIHLGIGLYRAAMKWGWFDGPRPAVTRRRLKTAMWALIGTYVALGAAGLLAYVRLGMQQAAAT
jgi:fumarate reductase subunit C